VTTDLSSRTGLFTALTSQYRVERELGSGGMATVYLAHDVKHDRKVALKVLKPELAAVLGAERFVAEIRTTASLSHPHILPLFDSGSVPAAHPDPERREREGPAFLYYVMPYIEGETLRDKLNRETQLGVDEAVRITTEVADALDYAHRRGIIHRDIKPENILLHDGRPMVADFGIALAVSAAAGGRMTETGLSLGTPHYMSPEQATADKDISGRSDIYSLASVLYEMLAGDPPHTGSSAQQIIMKIIAEPAEPVAKRRKTVPPHVSHAIATALEKLPADRFDSAKAFAGALANPAFAPTAATRAVALGGPSGAPRWTLALAASVALVSLCVAGWSLTRPAPVTPVSRFHMVFPDSQRLAPHDHQTRITIAPDARALAYLGHDPTVSGRWRIFVRRLDRLAAEPVPGTEDAINPSFAPDGKRIAFVSGTQRALKVVSLAGGPAQVLTDSLVDLGGVSWGADGYIYYDGHLAGDGLARIRESGGPPEIASRPANAAESWHSSPRALPNGRGVLFAIARDRAQLRTMSPCSTRALASTGCSSAAPRHDTSSRATCSMRSRAER
jgi:serine/threonine protein kinase